MIFLTNTALKTILTALDLITNLKHSFA
jgi:hypothetical protein